MEFTFLYGEATLNKNVCKKSWEIAVLNIKCLVLSVLSVLSKHFQRLISLSLCLGILSNVAIFLSYQLY